MYKLRSNDSMDAYSKQLWSHPSPKIQYPYANDFVINSYGES